MSLYEKIFKKPYPNGWKDRPSKETPITGAIMAAYDATIENIENGLVAQGGDFEKLGTKKVNGVPFGGTEDVDIPAGTRWCIGSDDTTKTGWHRFLEIQKPANDSAQLTIAVTSTQGVIGHGIFQIIIAGDETNVLIPDKSSIKWMYRYGIGENHIMASEDGEFMKFYIYLQESQLGRPILFQMISEGQGEGGATYTVSSYGTTAWTSGDEYKDLTSEDGGRVSFATMAKDANWAERAYCDADGKDISDTYLKKEEVPTNTVTITNNLLATVAGTALDAVQGRALNNKITAVDEVVGIETTVIDGVPNWRERGADTWSPFSTGGLSELTMNLRAYACGDLEYLSQGYNYLTIPSESVESIEVELTDFDWYEGSEAECSIRISKCKSSYGSTSVVLDSLHTTSSGGNGKLSVSESQLDAANYPYVDIYIEVYNQYGDTIWATADVTIKFK